MSQPQTNTDSNQCFLAPGIVLPKHAHANLLDWAKRIFPTEVSNVFDQPSGDSDPRRKRQNEFKLGRAIAEFQLAKLGHENPVGTIGINNDRSPDWPEGFVGSISHSDQWTWASVATSENAGSIGVDTEVITNPETRGMVQRMIGRPNEWEIAAALGADAETTFTLVFSAKEAFYKCLYPLYKAYFGFEDAEVIQADDKKIRIRRCANAATDLRKEISELDVFYHIEGNNVFTATWVQSQGN